MEKWAQGTRRSPKVPYIHIAMRTGTQSVDKAGLRRGFRLAQQRADGQACDALFKRERRSSEACRGYGAVHS
jgi:hypothetical protein